VTRNGDVVVLEAAKEKKLIAEMNMAAPYIRLSARQR